MKKIGWILGTAIVCVLWFVLVGFIEIGISIVISIATQSEISEVQTGVINVFMPIIVLGWIVLIILSVVMWKRWNAKCHACKRFGGLELEKTKILKQENISVLMELEHRNLDRHVTGTHDQYIPGKRKTFRDTYKCKYCGNLETRIRTEDSASI